MRTPRFAPQACTLAAGVALALAAPAVAAQNDTLNLRLERRLSLPPSLQPPTGEQPGSNAPPPATPPSATPDGGRPRPIPVAVTVNGARAGDWVLLDVRGVLHATADAFQEWRVLRAPETQGVPYRGQLWYPLDALPGYESQFDPATQSLELRFAPSAFATTRLVQPTPERLEVTPPLTSAFVNYDLSYTHSAVQGAPSAADLGALGELGLSTRHGVLTNTFVARNLAEDENLPPRSAHRLETTFTRDYPDSHTSLRLGDSTTPLGTWGRAVYFGGLQLGRNFALAPGLITQPIPAIVGQSTAPSTVELYVNDALRQTSQVPSGPFTIDNLPLLTGSGQARVVVRDLLGRETVLVQNFFSSAYLLRQGLSDWSVQAGAVRENLGIESDNYGERFASGLLRYGVNDSLTLETEAEASSRLRGGGLGLSAALFGQMLGQAALAGSRDDERGDGGFFMLGVEHATVRHGFTARTEGATRDYRRIGQNELLPPFRRQHIGSYTYFSDSLGHLGFAFARVEPYDQEALNTLSANYSVVLGKRASLTFSVTRVSGATSGTSVNAMLMIPLDGQRAVSGSVTHRDGRDEGYVSASQTLGAEAGTGWRALAGRRAGQAYAEGGAYYQGSRGLLSADASIAEQQQTLRLGAQGGLLLADGELFASRKLTESFALVEVPGYAGVGVGFQSTVLTRTDENGRALVPRLMPYRKNSIRLDPSELPISAELDTIEMTAVPPARSGVRVTFPVRAGRGALITILLEDGAPAPAGAELKLQGDDKEFFVARRGQAFVTGLQPKNTLQLKWKEKSCTLEVTLPEGDKDEIARIGPLVCLAVPR